MNCGKNKQSIYLVLKRVSLEIIHFIQSYFILVLEKNQAKYS
jgi:hypothetical protein